MIIIIIIESFKNQERERKRDYEKNIDWIPRKQQFYWLLKNIISLYIKFYLYLDSYGGESQVETKQNKELTG